jgi:hypothetical protein
MRRRDFIGIAGGAASAWAVDAFGQKIYRVAILTPSLAQWQPRTFRDALEEFGYREGVNARGGRLDDGRHAETPGLPSASNVIGISAVAAGNAAVARAYIEGF